MEQLTYQQMLEGVPDMTAAIERCYRLGGLSPSEAAFAVGVDYCHFVRMFRESGGRHFPPDLIEPLMKAAGNKFPLHWLAYRMGEATYPLEFMSILSGIKESLSQEGKPVRFVLCQEEILRWMNKKRR